MLRNVDNAINYECWLWVSCRPIEVYLPRGLDGARFKTLTQISGQEHGAAELEQLHMELNSEHMQSTSVYIATPL